MALVRQYSCACSSKPLLANYVISNKFSQVGQISFHLQSNLDYSKCQGPQESFRIIGSSNDRKREFSDIFGKARMLA